MEILVEKRVGILGGTFDPVHLAHLQLAKSAYEQFQLETVIFLNRAHFRFGKLYGRNPRRRRGRHGIG